MKTRVGKTFVKTPGHERKYNYDKIIEGFRTGKTNRQIAEDVGCTTGWIWELRGQFERGKLRW